MPAPDVEFILQDVAATTGGTSVTDTGFMGGMLTARGPATGQIAKADVCHSYADFVAVAGTQQSYNATEHAAVKRFFANGGANLYWSRKTGPNALQASAAIPTSSPKFTLKAKYPGTYGNGFTGAVTGGVATLVGLDINGDEVTETYTATSAADLETQVSLAGSLFEVEALAGGTLTDSAEVPLANGTDDRANITDAEIAASLARFGSELGAGQVDLPGDYRFEAAQMLAEHCAGTDTGVWRFALPTAPDGDADEVVDYLGDIEALGWQLARRVQPIVGWPIVAGVARPGSSGQMGLCAQNDLLTDNPGLAVAGPQRGVHVDATSLSRTYTRTEQNRIADAGGTLLRVVDGQVVTFDDIVPVDPDSQPEWWAASVNRFVMRLREDVLRLGRAHQFDSNSGIQAAISFEGHVNAYMQGWHARGVLYSETDQPGDSFSVNARPPVNTAQTAQRRVFVCNVKFKFATPNRDVKFVFVNLPLSEVL